MLAQTNAILRSRLADRITLVTAFLAIVDGDVLRYANAGHVPPLVVGAGRRAARAADDGAAAGHRATARVRAARAARSVVGELLFASTDGLTEARRDGEQFGQDRVSALVAEHAGALGPQELVELAYARAVAWAPQLDDDVAIIALRPR